MKEYDRERILTVIAQTEVAKEYAEGDVMWLINFAGKSMEGTEIGSTIEDAYDHVIKAVKLMSEAVKVLRDTHPDITEEEIDNKKSAYY